MPDLKLTKETFVSIGVLVSACAATAYIATGATNANAKVDLLTATTSVGFASVAKEMSDMKVSLVKIEANQDKQAQDASSFSARIAVLEADMRRVQSTQPK